MGRPRSKLAVVKGVSIWKRTGAGPRAAYYITYKNPRTGKYKTEAVSDDYDLTVEVAKEIRARQVRHTKGIVDGVRDRWAEEDMRPIEDHLAEWEKSMRDSAKDAKHVRQFHGYARAVLLGNEAERRELAENKRRKRGQRRSQSPVELKPLGIQRVGQIIASKVQSQIGKVKAQRSAATANRYLDALNTFLNWGVGDRRWERNACKHLPRFSAAEDRRVTRRAVEVEHFRKLIEATEAADSPKVARLTGAERSRIYRFTVASGFRRGEVRGARVQDLQRQPTAGIWTRASISRKNKKRIFVPLPPSLVDELLEVAAGKGPAEKLLNCPCDTARMLRVDLARAGIPYKTAAGTFDFHAVRHTTATLLISAGVTNVKAIQEHMRHSRADLTTDTYGHLLESDRSATAKALPDFSKGGRSAVRAQGSTGNGSHSESPNVTEDAPQGGQKSLNMQRKAVERRGIEPRFAECDSADKANAKSAVTPEGKKSKAALGNATPANGAAPAQRTDAIKRSAAVARAMASLRGVRP